MVTIALGNNYHNGGKPLDCDVLMGIVLPEEDAELRPHHARLIFLDGHYEILDMRTERFKRRSFVPFPENPTIELAVLNE